MQRTVSGFRLVFPQICGVDGKIGARHLAVSIEPAIAWRSGSFLPKRRSDHRLNERPLSGSRAARRNDHNWGAKLPANHDKPRRASDVRIPYVILKRANAQRIYRKLLFSRQIAMRPEVANIRLNTSNTVVSATEFNFFLTESMSYSIVLAETEGFEPSVRFPVRRFSKALVSATHPRLRAHAARGL